MTDETVKSDRKNMSEQINELAASLAKAQGEIKSAVKGKENPHFKFWYADLASVWDACREPLSKNGLSIVQLTEPSSSSGISLTTILFHSSGQWISSNLEMTPLDNSGKPSNNPQAVGSCISYMRRYMLASMVGVASDDDDANSASGKDDDKMPQSKGQKDKPPKQEKQTAPLPKGENWECKEKNGVRYLVTANQDSSLRHEELINLGFIYNIDTLLYSKKFDEEQAKLLSASFISPEKSVQNTKDIPK
jgi:hypothetical protein